MGIGTTTSAAASTAALSGKPVAEVTGPGTGVSAQALIHKQQIAEKALNVNGLNKKSSPLDVLQKVGGLEIAAMTGMVLEAQERRLPVPIDRFLPPPAPALPNPIEPNLQHL